MLLSTAALARPVVVRTASLAWWMALIGLCVVLLVPLLVIDVPPLRDYPNHLARIFVLASDDPVLAHFYAPHWSIIPNLALDLIGPPLIHLVPVHVAGRILIAVSVLLPVWGTIAYNTALGGRWWSLGVGLVPYNACLLSGFLNFEISLGCALLLAAGWLRWREHHPMRAIVLALLGTPVLFACHLMGLVFFGLLIGGAELCQLQQERTITAVFRRGIVVALVFAAPAILYLLSDLQHLGGDAGFLPLGTKLLQLTTPFVNYDWLLDLTTAGFAIGLPAIGLALRRGRVPGPASWAILLLAIAFLATPFAWKQTFALDTRFAIMLGFMLFAGFIPVRWPPRLWKAAVTTLVVLFVARMTLLTDAWASQAADLADLRSVLVPVRPGQAVYVAQAGRTEAPAYWAANARWRELSDGTGTGEHLGALAVIERRAYWPFEFDTPSQQPIETREPYRSMAERVGGLPDRDQAAAADVCGFDYVLLLEADAVSALPTERFRLLAQSGFAALYAITQCKPG